MKWAERLGNKFEESFKRNRVLHYIVSNNYDDICDDLIPPKSDTIYIFRPCYNGQRGSGQGTAGC